MGKHKDTIMTKVNLLAITLLALLLGACAGQDIPDPEPTDTTVDGSGAGTDGYGDEDMGDGTFFDDESQDELVMVIFFGFDQSDIRLEDQATLERHANQLANDSSARVRLEGHADERGSREYNIGLGERRSQAVRKLLLLQGASARQISTVSFGEERPAAFGSDEESYAQNRRVEIKYTAN
jgi:peptidoglycan-associated lipoprotein